MSRAPALARAVALADLLDFNTTFHILEIGARPIEKIERSHALLELFPGSRISAFEIDPALCDKLNRTAKPGMQYHACALGRADESRTLYETTHPTCSSLYEPDTSYADVYGGLDTMRLAATHEVRTRRLDAFVREAAIGPVDFIKIDVQGAELDVLEGAGNVLDDVLAIVTEVEFVPMYKGQPLYGDLDAHLRSRGFAFYTFLTQFGGVIKPLDSGSVSSYPKRIMWADALFARDIVTPSTLAPEALLKLAVLLDLYDAGDAAHHLLRRYDSACSTRLASEYLEIVTADGKWQEQAQ